MKTFAVIAAALSLLTGCVVEDRVIIRDSHPRPYHYGYHHWQPAPSYWHRGRSHGHGHHRGYGHRPYRW
jgi:hypothetical protein